MRRDGILHSIRRSYSVVLERGIYRFRNSLAATLPFSANIYQRFWSFAGTMKRKHKPSLRQEAFQYGFIKSGAGDVQSFLVALPQKARELVPCPAAYLRYCAHDLR